ncbi:hypothetical protein FHETE_428 [Fusarium heterosporum]|uniref:Uncharacterized protein n=1 Tax=Fusarium heterosporum TaxID=42747 RepID=A0A8H5U0M5_FUSHE|nr:hypothetical protein FHETE_428 [Fusarium heterosporum]
MNIQKAGRAKVSDTRRRTRRPYQGKHKPIGFEPPRRVLDNGEEKAKMVDRINVSTESEGTSARGSKTQDTATLGTNHSVDQSVQDYTASPFDLFPDLPKGPGSNGETALGGPETDESFLEPQGGEDTVMEDFNLASNDMPETSLELEYQLSLLEEQRLAGT